MQYAVVVCRYMAERCKRPTIDEGVGFDSSNSAFIISKYTHLNSRWVTASIDPVDLLSIEINANWSATFSGQNGCTHFVGKGVGFAPKSTTDKGTVDIDLMHWNVEYCGQCSVQIVWNLLRAPNGHSPGRVPMGNYSVWFGKSMVQSSGFPISLMAVWCCGHRVQITELLEHTFLNIGFTDVILPTIVNRVFRIFQPVFHVVNTFQYFIIHHNGIHGVDCRSFINRTNTSNQITDVTDSFLGHGMLIFGHREDTELVHRILAGGHSKDTIHCFSNRSINRFDFRVVMW